MQRKKHFFGRLGRVAQVQVQSAICLDCARDRTIRCWVSCRLDEAERRHDITPRHRGEKFVIALPNTTLRLAITVADHIRRAVMAKELMKRSSGERLGRVTFPSALRCCVPTTPDRARRRQAPGA
jgi:hypothetical protein